MLRDASHRQVIQKFSFIKTLDLSHLANEEETVVMEKELDSQLVGLTRKSSQEVADALVPATTTTTIDSNWYQADIDSFDLNLAEIVKYTASEATNQNKSLPERNYLGKIMFSLAVGYCLFVLWWLFGHQGSKMITAMMGGRQITLSKADLEFIDYAERSLATIERQLAAEKAEQEEEKVVYVPVYTPPTTPSLPSISNVPLSGFPSNNLPSITQSTPIAEPTSEPLKIPAPPPLPPSTPLETSAQVAVAQPKPAIKSTLIGILELGNNKSAALVKVQGETRRIWLGEKINDQGWILESVGNQTANIAYQGQVRSISVGETF